MNGFELNIGTEVLKRMDEADKKLQQIATHSEEVSKAMKKLSTDGINSVVSGLTQMNTHLSKLSQNNGFSNMGAQASQSVDAINKMIDALAKLTSMQEIKLQTQQAKVDYKKEANDIKELAVAENERARALERQDKSNAANDKQRQALLTKQLANDTKELMNREQERGRQLILQNQKNIAAYTKQSVKIKQQIDEINRLAAAYKKLPTALKQADVNKLITSSSKAKTINQHITAIHNLQNALRDLDTTSKNYKNNVKRINAEITRNRNELNRLGVNIDKVKNQKRKLIDTAGQLQRKLSLLFSVSQIVGYFNKMVAIRKEMELQQKSLQVLLQNKDEADKLWNQVIDLAVKSPFRVKELVTYTKQLAAYRIESDQLFDTTKRLSDVSAGLGVDMQRLILAYGQIRAAGFLRGTELRQLTEAGLPMLDELAKYLTELEGRTIRTGDVFEMISKRMVSFKDVQAVFQRMTNEGGVFFNMQEEQAKTLAGSISNLHDSIDLMLNDIGKANDSTLKGTIASVRSLVENWREVKAAMNAILVAASPLLIFWGLAKVASSAFAKSLLVLAGHSKLAMKVLTFINPSLSKFAAKTNFAAAAVKGLRTALGGLTTLGIGALLYYISDALTDLYLSATRASREAEELRKNLNGIISEDTTNLNKQVDGFKDLSTRLEKANEGSKERRDIISSLNSQYGEYLDFVVTEKTSIDDLASSYDKVVERMKEKAALATFEKGIQAINDSYGRQLEDATEDFYSLFKGASIQKEIDSIAGFTNIVPTKKEVDDIFNLIQQRIREKKIEEIDSLEEQKNLLDEIIKGYYGDSFSLSQMPLTSIDLIDIFVERKKQELKLQQQINQSYKQTLQSQEANLAFERLQNEYALKQKEIRETQGLSNFEVQKQLENAKKQFELDKIELKFQFGEISQNEMIDAKNKVWKWASETIMAVNEQIERELSGIFSEEEYSQILIKEEEYAQGISAILKNTTDNYELHNQLLMAEISLKDAGKQFDEKKIQYYERLIELDKFRAKALGIELDLVQKIDQESVKSINSQLDPKYQISLEDSYKSVLQLQEEANKKRQDAIKLEAALLLQREKGVAISESTLQGVQADVAGWTKLWELLGGQEKEKGKTDKTRRNSLYDERIKVIDDMNKKYKELNKTLEKSEALQGAFDAYIDAFATAFEEISWIPSNVRQMTPQEFASQVLNFPNENDLVSFLDRLSKEPMKTFEKIKVELAKGEYVYDIKVRAKAESDKEIIEQIEELFGNYEISLELQKLNIPPDLAKQLFGIDPIDLSTIRATLEDKLKAALAKGGQEDLVKDLQKQLEKVDEMEDKALQERLKKYSKYLATAMGERVKVKMEEIRAISEIENTKEFSDDQKELAKQGVRKESQAKLDKLEWEEFKDSGMYVQLFEDLEYASTKSLKSMRTQLEQLKGSLKNLDADDLRHLYNQIEKLDDVLAKRNPFKTFINGLDDYRNAVKNTKYLDDNLASTQDEYNKAKQIETNIDLKLAKYREEYNQKSKNNKLSEQENDTYLYNISLLESQLRIAREATKLKKEGVEQAQKEVDTNNKIKKLFKESGGEVGKYISQAANALPEIAGDLENVFGYMDAGTRDTIESISEIAGGIGDTMQSIASGDYIGAIVGAAKTIGAIFAVGDKKKERQIQKEIEFVDKLGRAYEKLQQKIEDAYSINTLQQSGKNAKANLEAQIASYRKMISAEEDKKKTDKNRIEEWEYAIEEIQQQIDDMNKDLISTATAGIMDSVLSASQEFTEAWLSAFQETGNGLSGLEDNFKETMLEMVKQQASMLISQSYVERWKKQLEQYINPDDLELSTDEAKKWVNAVTTSLPQLNQALENYFNAMQQAGVDLSGGTGGELSGLQRGIQGVTEETAQIIEAYLNSIRFFVAENNTYLSQIASAFSSGDVENPMVSQLRIIAQQTSAINTLLNSLTKSGHSLGGVGLKVFIS